VLRRVFAPDVDAKSAAGKRHIWQIARELLPRTGRATWTHNQALMELGALVCTARVARCGQCPVRRECLTARQGLAGLARGESLDRASRRRSEPR
jgi:A/G-specific adenine glycosylase